MAGHFYKIALLIFTNTKTESLSAHKIIESMIKDHELGVLKDVQVLDRDESIIGPVVEDYKNTNLGMIILMAKDAEGFFPFSELEEIGQRNDKFLVTLNLNENLANNFQGIIDKVKASKGKPYRGCENSCS